MIKMVESVDLQKYLLVTRIDMTSFNMLDIFYNENDVFYLFIIRKGFIIHYLLFVKIKNKLFYTKMSLSLS